MQVRSSLNLILERERLEVVQESVREQFEDRLRALTDAEDDSKQVKSAKRSLLFDRIIESVELPFPVGPAAQEGEPVVKDGMTKQFVKKAAEAICEGARPHEDRGRQAAPRRARRRGDRRSRARSASRRARTARASSPAMTQILSLLTLGTAKEGSESTISPSRRSAGSCTHYNFPPYSVGETGFMRGPKRRDIGHSALAQQALEPIIPGAEEFPVRIVSETLESNSSSSMGSVCGSTLALMDAGVPIAAPVSASRWAS